MIPKEKIEQLAEERFGFNSATENYKGWVNGFECGVSFAETELQSIAMEFGKFLTNIDGDHYFWCDIEKVWRISQNGKVVKFKESDLFAKFMAERQTQ